MVAGTWGPGHWLNFENHAVGHRPAFGDWGFYPTLHKPIQHVKNVLDEFCFVFRGFRVLHFVTVPVGVTRM